MSVGWRIVVFGVMSINSLSIAALSSEVLRLRAKVDRGAKR